MDLRALMNYVAEVTARGGGTECEIVTESMSSDEQGNYIDLTVHCEEPCQGYDDTWKLRARVRESIVEVQFSNEEEEHRYSLTHDNFSEFIANQQRFHIEEYSE